MSKNSVVNLTDSDLGDCHCETQQRSKSSVVNLTDSDHDDYHCETQRMSKSSVNIYVILKSSKEYNTKKPNYYNSYIICLIVLIVNCQNKAKNLLVTNCITPLIHKKLNIITLS